MVRIPSEYQEVEYIESTGGQWIDTLYIPTIDTTAFVKFLAVERNNAGYFGARRDPYHFCCTTYSNGTTFGLNINKSIWTSNRISLELNKVYKCEFKNGYSKINNIEYYEEAEQEWPSTANIGTFVLAGKNASGVINANFTTKAKYYDCKLWENTSLVRNLIPCYRKSDNEIGMYDTVTKQFYTNSGTGTFLKGNDVTYDNINLLESRRRILLNTPHIETISDTIASFKTDVATKLKGCKIHFTPIQEGEGDPSPENVRPIHGWDRIEVTACGKNLFDRTGEAVGRFINSGGTSINSNGWSHSDYIPIKGGQTYIFNPNTTAGGTAKHILYDSAKGYIDYLNSGETIFTAPDNTCFIRFSYRTASENIQLELGSTATAYEPYQSTTLTIPFPQTIYGGYVDLVKGEVVEEWVRRDMDTFSGIDAPNSSYEPWNHRFSVKNWKNGVGYDRKSGGGIRVYSDCIKSGVGLGKTNYTADDTTANWYIYDDTISTVSEYKEKYTSHYAVYRLRDSLATTYPLTPQSLKALRGMNNIWSNASGNIEVSFYTH